MVVWMTDCSLVIIVLVDVEVPQLIRRLVWRNDVEEIPELLLLEVLLGEVLQVSLGEWCLCCDMDLVGLLASDRHSVAEVASLAANLYAVLEKLLEICHGHDVVIHWLLAVHCELQRRLLGLGHALLLQSLDHHCSGGDCLPATNGATTACQYSLE